MSDIPPDNAGRAVYWRVGERTIKRLLVLGAPLHSVEEMIVWAKDRHDVPAGILSKLRDEQGLPASDSEDLAEFKKTYDPKQEADTQAQLKELQAYQLYKVKKAQERGDAAAVMAATKLLTHFSNVINDEELRAFRLGKETGDIIQRAEVESYLHAINYWHIRCIDEYTAEVVPELVQLAAAGKLDRDSIKATITSPLIDGRIVKPIDRALSSTSGMRLPAWFAECITKSLDRIVKR